MTTSAEQIGKNAKAAFLEAQELSHDDQVSALLALRDALDKNRDAILQANQNDVQNAKELVKQNKLQESTLKRLDLQSSPDKYDSMLQGVAEVAHLPNLVGQVSLSRKLDDDLELVRVATPIGVILVIFEARPEVIVNITSLAIKSGNAAILKGGKESLLTQAAICKVVEETLSKTKVPKDFIQMVSSRDEISQLLKLSQYIDLVIPRGSNDLVRTIQSTSQIPVMGHADGICSIYLDDNLNVPKAKRIILDSKLTYPSACNAVETLLVNQDLLSTTWPDIAHTLTSNGIKLLCDDPSYNAIPEQERGDLVAHSSESDYDTEFLDKILAVKTVQNVRQAIAHIHEHSSQHTDSIITENKANASLFCKAVSSAGVYVNASTRFADGFRYGFGTEVGVSTSKTHARGPVGLEGLLIYKYHITSSNPEGSITSEYGPGKKPYLHKDTPLQPPY